jgi:hypothetical protein
LNRQDARVARKERDFESEGVVVSAAWWFLGAGAAEGHGRTIPISDLGIAQAIDQSELR